MKVNKISIKKIDNKQILDYNKPQFLIGDNDIIVQTIGLSHKREFSAILIYCYEHLLGDKEVGRLYHGWLKEYFTQTIDSIILDIS